MMFGTVIILRKEDTFITEAMLASYLNVDKKDYLTLIEPFILKCLPAFDNEPIDIKSVTDRLNTEFSLCIVNNVVEKILIRLTKKKNGSKIRRSGNKFYVNEDINTDDFDNRRNTIKREIEIVISAFKNYLQEEKYLHNITEDLAKDYFIKFLETYNYSVLESTESVGDITINDKHEKTNYYVAQFILKEFKNKSSIYNDILEIIKGTLVAKSIYYFMYKNDSFSKLQGTEFYLDTRLLIEALGYNTENEKIAMDELLRLIRKEGGKLKTFRHYVIELQNILISYRSEQLNRFSFTLDKFNRENYSNIDINLEEQTLETKLKLLNIDIVDEPDYTTIITQQKWHIDYTELKKSIIRFYKL